MRRTIKAAIGGGIAVALAGGITSAVLVSRAAAIRVAPTQPVPVSTATVTRTNLAETQTLPGTLGYGAQMTVNGMGSGIITGLPAVGTLVTRGQVLYRVNDQPVVLFYGSTPLFRTLAPPKVVTSPPASPPAGTPPVTKAPAPPAMTPSTPVMMPTGTPRPPETPTLQHIVPATNPPAQGQLSGRAASPHLARLTSTTTPLTGHDVTVVAQNLAALGYDTGAQPPPSDGKDTYTPALSAAVKDWQERVGMKPTGTLSVGQVVVLSGPVRVARVTAQLGDPVSGQLLTVSSTAKTVTVAAAATDLTSVVQGASADIALPDGTTVPGEVTAIGQTVQSGTGSDTGASGTATYNITVTPLRQAQVARLQSAPVQVTFVTATVHNVLAVPVNALLALAGGGYALQRTDGTLIAVQTGLFANGMVQVTGTGVRAGLKVRSA